MLSVSGVLSRLPAPPLERFFGPLDALRRWSLRTLAPVLRSWIVVRDYRVAVSGSALLVGALLLALFAPMWLLLLGPVLWGVPHVIADFRYLIVQRGFLARPAVLASIGLATALAALGTGIRGALVGAGVGVLVAKGAPARRWLCLLVLLVLFVAAAQHARTADLVFGHLHNFVAVGLWWAWRQRETRAHWLPLATFAAGVLLVLSGAGDAPLAHSLRLSGIWAFVPSHFVRTFSPTSDSAWVLRCAALYAFAQSAHYVVWLRLIPEEARATRTPRSFSQSYRVLAADVGGTVLWIALVSAAALGAWALHDLVNARDVYIRLASFHGYLEVVVIAVLWVEAGTRPPRTMAANEAATPVVEAQ